jgi:hypothetical protein
MEEQLSAGFLSGIGPFVQQLVDLANQNPVYVGWYFFSHGLWIIVVIIFAKALYNLWLDGRQGVFARKKWKFVLLAIDIPKNNIQTPKAVENIFSAVMGAQKSPNLVEEYWEGALQESFSFEIVSLEGYVQFLIRCTSGSRDLIEAAIYAQYPDAEITEVEDYTQDYAKLIFPNPEYNLWGTEFILVKDYPYPIRSYNEFEHTLSGELLDPMAGLMEIMTRFGPGEQLWLQLVVTPMPPGKWGDAAEKVVKKMSGQNYEPPKTFSDQIGGIADVFTNNLDLVLNETIGWSLGGADAKKDDKKDWNLQKLTPGEKNVLEKVQNKLSKHRFRFKFRMIYLGKHEVFNKGRGISAVIGAIQQYNSSDCNGFKPGKRTKTSADYFLTAKRIAERQGKIMRQYVTRTNFYGEDVGNHFMCQEELATLWHFPVMSVKAATVERTESKRAAPPSRLPYQQRISAEKREVPVASDEPVTKENVESIRPISPALPIVEESASIEAVLPTKAIAPTIQTVETRKEIKSIKKVAPTLPSISATVPAKKPETVNSGEPAKKKAAPPPNLPFA